MPRHENNLPSFRDDVNDPTPRSAGPGAGTVGRVKTNTVDMDQEFSPSAKWQSVEEREKGMPIFNEEAQVKASEFAADPATVALREAALKRAAERRFDEFGKLVEGQESYQRTEEVLVDAPTHRILRTSDGTVRTDLRSNN